MARPKTKSESEAAGEWIRELGSKLDDGEFCEKVLVKEPSSHYAASYDAKKAERPGYSVATATKTCNCIANEINRSVKAKDLSQAATGDFSTLDSKTESAEKSCS